MSSTPHGAPEPWHDAFGILASDEAGTAADADAGHIDPDSDEGTEWSTTSAPVEAPGQNLAHHVSTWHAEPAADEEWYDEDAAVVTPSHGTLYSSGPGLPARGVVLTAGVAVGACALLDFALTGRVGFFFDLCFVVICLVAAMAAAPRALFTVAVMPPLVFAAMIGLVALAAPKTIASGGFTAVFLTGLADHAVPLCIAYGVALLVASARGLALRGAGRR